VRATRECEGYVRLVARLTFAGHILWSQTEPSLMWLPFFLMRRLHLGQVPITLSSTIRFRGRAACAALYTSAA
jgi:hypothetical protein